MQKTKCRSHQVIILWIYAKIFVFEVWMAHNMVPFEVSSASNSLFSFSITRKLLITQKTGRRNYARGLWHLGTLPYKFFLEFKLHLDHLHFRQVVLSVEIFFFFELA